MINDNEAQSALNMCIFTSLANLFSKILKQVDSSPPSEGKGEVSLFRIEINRSLQGSTANGAENGVLVCAHAAVV